MHTEELHIPMGQRLVKHDEAMSGRVVAMTEISHHLFAIHYVTPSGYFCDEKYASTRPIANQLFERRLVGNC